MTEAKALYYGAKYGSASKKLIRDMAKGIEPPKYDDAR